MEKKNKKEWSSLDAMEVVFTETKGNNFDCSDELLGSALSYLSEKLSISKVQAMLLAVLINSECSLTWGVIAKHFKSTLIKAMSFNGEMSNLVKRRWVRRSYTNANIINYQAVPEVINALSHDRVYVPRPLSGKTTQQFVDEIRTMFKSFGPINVNMIKAECAQELVEANSNLPICRLALQLNEVHSLAIYFKVVEDYFKYIDNEEEVGISTNLFDFNFEDMDFSDEQYLITKLENGDHELFDLGLIEHKCSDGLADPNTIVLSAMSIEALSEYKMKRAGRHIMLPHDYVKTRSIKQKPLFYNEEDNKQMSMLAELLSKDQLPKIQQRLVEKGFHKGVACLLHGYPGTGKTASVYELARQTGRDIMPVDIASMRDKYVGETEKAVKRVFSRYRELCEASTVAPILLFNEADALINKRMENVDSSVDKMENSMQNIILQEMENLDGILIPTTNLISNLDEAFDRRFLFKIELHKPEVAVKTKIWKSMIGELSDNDAYRLASKYDFSGGQIENIARKQSIEYVISGKFPTFDEIDFFCQKEILKRKNTTKPVLGFVA